MIFPYVFVSKMLEKYVEFSVENFMNFTFELINDDYTF